MKEELRMIEKNDIGVDRQTSTQKGHRSQMGL
jgi:hypothetical protein